MMWGESGQSTTTKEPEMAFTAYGPGLTNVPNAPHRTFGYPFSRMPRELMQFSFVRIASGRLKPPPVDMVLSRYASGTSHASMR